MNTKVLLATLAGSIAAFLLGWIVYGILLMNVMTENTIVYAGLMKEPPNLVGIFLAGVCMAWLMAYIFYRWAGISDFAKGFMGGLIISFPIVLNYDISFYSFFNLYSTSWLVMDVIVSTLFYGIIGGIIGWVLGMGKKPQPAA